LLSESDLSLLVKQLTTINKAGEAFGKIKGVHAMTDVTGFGLAGHLTEMMTGSNLTAKLAYSKIPIIPEVRNYIAQKAIPGATARNWNASVEGIELDASINEQEASLILPDPQTNGGLLIAVSPNSVSEVLEVLNAAGIVYTEPIGVCEKYQGKRIVVNP
jgi:selenide,water dikinase